ncbi:MAG: hypothetical protein E6538_13405 [Paeniclostridium sordellii]|uniref:hypothetical protein n=1 Tax=Paraclostridium sordellii TaxID=1505 RepID=UPI000E53B76B|nr:hypothetical protein [Paeniclostridium sordellii]MDU6482987.1 hypothetical protein [Paeniclostridium sordellii]RGX06264.1 hypothetical protein DWV40_11480 [Paeniclostridium sordellii]
MKKKRTFYLSDNDMKYIEDFQKEHKLTSKNTAFSEILTEHKMKAEIPMQTMYEFIAKKVAEELEATLKDSITDKLIDTLKPQLNSLKFATNSVSKDTQITLELLNGIYYKKDLGNIPTTDSLPSMAYKLSKEYVEEKIKKQQRIKSGSLD